MKMILDKPIPACIAMARLISKSEALTSSSFREEVKLELPFFFTNN